MNRTNRLKKNSRRFAFSNILAKEYLIEQMEERIVPAYVSGEFGWAASIDTGNINIELRSLTVDTLGNVYQVGNFTGTVDFDPGTGITNFTAVGGQDGFVAKLDSTGKIIWVKTFGGTANEKAASITLDAFENPIITGWYQGTVDFDPNASVYNKTSQGAEDVFIVKLNMAGDLLWAKSVGGTSSDQGFEACTDPTGNIIIGGLFYGTADFDPSPATNNLITSSGSQDIFILKLDNIGNFLWAKGVLGRNNKTKDINDLQSDSNGNIVFCGTFFGTIDIDPGAGSYLLNNVGYLYNGYLVKLNQDGMLSWGQQLASSATAQFGSVSTDSFGAVYAGGAFQNTVDFDPSINIFNLSSSGSHDAFLEKLGADGSFCWARSFGSGGTVDDVRGVRIDSSQTLKAVGVSSNNSYLATYSTNGDLFGSRVTNDTSVYTISRSGPVVTNGFFSKPVDFDPELPVKSLSPLGGSNLFITQWNRLFTKTNLVFSDSRIGTNATLTATIQNENSTTVNGTVTFTDLFNGVTTTLGTAIVMNGVATLTLLPLTNGVHSFTANYSGDATNLSSTASRLVTPTQTILNGPVSEVLYYRFDEGVNGYTASGTGTIIDKSGNAFNATALKSPTYSSDVPQSSIPTKNASNYLSMNFNGTSQQIVIADKPAFQLTHSLTLEAFIKPFSDSVGQILFRGDNRLGLDPYYLTMLQNKTLMFRIMQVNGTSVDLFCTLPSLNHWCHVAGTLDDATGQMNLYLDGVLQASTVTTVRPFGELDANNKPGIGIGNFQEGNSSQPFYGLIDEVRISNQALSPSQFLNSTIAGDNPSVFGQTVTFTASINSTTFNLLTPSGSVTFMDGTTVLGTVPIDSSGVAAFTTSKLAVGTHSVTSFYSGDTNFRSSYSTNRTQIVNQAETLITLTSDTTSAASGQPVKFTAQVASAFPGAGTPSGLVTFKDGSTIIGTGTLNSNGVISLTSTTLTDGVHTITAIYGGNTDFTSSTSPAYTQTVYAISASSLTISSGNNQSTIVAKDFDTLSVRLVDTNSNPVSNAYVAFTINTNGASGTFETSSIVLTDASGYATAPKLTANKIIGSFTVTASVKGVSNTVFNLTNIPDEASAIFIIGGNNQSTVVNKAFAESLQAKVADRFGNPVSGIPVQFQTPSTGASASFNLTGMIVTNSQGIATSPAITANTISGIYNVIVTANGSVSDSFRISNLAGISTIITKTSGNNQSTLVNKSFASILQLRVTDLYGNPVVNVPVSFSVPNNGASLVLSSTLPVTTNDQGVVFSPAITANTIAGSYSVNVTANGNINDSFNMTNLAGVASAIVKTSGNNQSTAVDTVFSSMLQLKVTDIYGNPVANVPVSLNAPYSGASLTFASTAPVTTNAQGVFASSAITANTIAGNYSINVTANGNVTDSFSLTNLAGAASVITKTSGNNQSTVVNTAFSNPLQLKVTDTFGNSVANVPVSFTAPTTGASLTFASTSPVTTNSQGFVSSPAITANTVAGNFAVTMSVNGNITESFSMTNLAGAASAIIKTSGNNQSTVVNTTFSNSLQLKVTDAFGNPVANVPVSFTAPNTGASLVLASTVPITTNAQGIVYSPAITANTVAGNFAVNVTANGNITESFSMTNLAGAASTIIKTSGNNQSTVVNAAFSNPIQLKVTDAYGNPVANVPVSFTAPNSGASLVLASIGAGTTNAQGIVSSPAITANTVAGNFAVNVTANGNLTDSFSLTNLAGAASTIIKTSVNNQSTVVNTAFSNPLQLKVTDAYGNPVANVPVSFNVPSSGASLVLGSTTPVSTNAQGIVSSPAITANTIVGSYSVNVTANGNVTDSFTFTNLAGAAAKFTITAGDKQSTTVNTSFASGLKVLVTDTFNNPVPNTPVTFTVPSSGASVVLAGSNAINTNSTGNATLDGLTANKVAGSFTVLATVSNLQTLNLNLTNNPGAVTSLVPVNGNNQSSVINGPFQSALQVKVVDAFGNAVPNVPVSFTSPTTGASAKFIGATSANSDNSGVASLSGLIANVVVGSYSVTATATGATNATFALRNAAPTVQSLVVQQGGTGRSFVRYVDLNINDAITVNTLVSSLSGSAPKIRITNTGLDGKAKTAVVIKGLTKASGNLVKIDFGTNGIGGNAATNVGDGSYLIEMDLDGNGSFETSQRFFRLLGDVNGDKVVDAKDTALVKASLNKTGSNLPADTNGDGKVNASDTSYVARAQRRRIRV